MWAGWRFGMKIAGYGPVGQATASAVLNGPYGQYLQVMKPEHVDFNRDIAVLIFDTEASKHVSLVVDELIKKCPQGVCILLFPIGSKDVLGDDYLNLKNTCNNTEAVVFFEGPWEDEKISSSAGSSQIIALVEAFAAAGEFDEFCDFDFSDFNYIGKRGELTDFVNFCVPASGLCFESFQLALATRQQSKKRCTTAYLCIRTDIAPMIFRDAINWVRSILHPEHLILSMIFDPIVGPDHIQVSMLTYQHEHHS
jgi:hypothetical protein